MNVTIKEVLISQLDGLYFALGIHLTPEAFSDIVKEALSEWVLKDHADMEGKWDMPIEPIDNQLIRHMLEKQWQECVVNIGKQ